ncbi:MAG: hypothetical protein IJJ14_03045, partial [Coriobacteriales bacterium]|nr:hypothetical protein [Coriobacteriales bacterium]
MGGKDVENREQQRLSQKISRRRFVQLGGMTALGLIAGGLPALSGCRSEAGDRIFRGERTITDHAGRTMTVPTPKKTAETVSAALAAQPLEDVGADQQLHD